MDQIVICGLGAAGFAALTAIRRTDNTAGITIIDPKSHDIQHPCALPMAIGGELNGKNLMEDLPSMAGIDRIKGYATQIDPEKRKVTVQKGNTTEDIKYKSLILATGSKPVIPQLPGIEALMGKKLHTLASVEDMESIRDSMKGAGSAIVIGGGAIGCECAAALRSGIENVILVELKDQLLDGVLDPDMESLLRNHLSASGIDIRTGTTVTSLLGKDFCQGVGTINGDIESDLVIIATGMRPDLSLVTGPDGEKTILEHNENGIWVDTHLLTSEEKIYAAGDCISQWSIIGGENINTALATCAYKQGLVAGTNAAGGDTTYMGTAGTFVSSIAGLEIAGTGFTAEKAISMGYTPVTGKITCNVRPSYMPDPGTITVKIIYDLETNRILGAQAVGKEGAASRINVISTAIEFAIPASE